MTLRKLTRDAALRRGDGAPATGAPATSAPVDHASRTLPAPTGGGRLRLPRRAPPASTLGSPAAGLTSLRRIPDERNPVITPSRRSGSRGTAAAPARGWWQMARDGKARSAAPERPRLVVEARCAGADLADAAAGDVILRSPSGAARRTRRPRTSRSSLALPERFPPPRLDVGSPPGRRRPSRTVSAPSAGTDCDDAGRPSPPTTERRTASMVSWLRGRGVGSRRSTTWLVAGDGRRRTGPRPRRPAGGDPTSRGHHRSPPSARTRTC